MKKSSILILIIICLCSCGKSSKKVSITGEIKGLGTDTLYLYGMDESFDRIDTIFAKNDKFSYTASIDTITSAFLLIDNQTEYLEQLNEAISLSEKTEIGKYAPFFSLPNIKGEKITRSSEDFKKKNLLINFWASWGDSISNHQSNTELKEIYQKYKKNKHIAMLGISLDMDKQEWQDAIKRDTLNWEQVCDFGGLNSEVAKQYAIKQVPSNILLSADGKILAKNLKGEQLKKKIEEVVTAAEEKEKQDNKKKK